MPVDLAAAATRAILPSAWDKGNDVLYGMCTQHPFHTDVPAVIVKVWLIGRSYAAAIERRRNKTGQNDDFYVQSVGPAIVGSGIDSWIASARRHEHVSRASIDVMLEVHGRTTKLFSEISGLAKRSIASKYLHFHVPKMFYIYDTRSLEALRSFSSVTGRASKTRGANDNEYRKFAEKCLILQEHVEVHHGVHLTPRHIDNLLLQVHSLKYT